MKLTKLFLCWLTLAWLVCANGVVSAQSTSFTFTLDEPCKTSAGVFAPDGTLIRTLWSKVRYYSPGTYSSVWDGLDDHSNAVPAGVYQIKLLQHNTEYVWDGVVGNTSAEISGPTVHNGFWPMADMAISGTNAFYVSGYNEGKYDFRNFLTTDPQHVKMAWYWVYSAQFNRMNSVPGDINDLNWLWVAADANRVYFACSGTPNPNNLAVPYAYPGCVVACNVADNSPAFFTSGVQILNNGANSPLPNGIYVGTQPGLSGLTVQQNGHLLAVSVASDNQVYLIDKTAGTAVANFNVSSPGRLNFSPDGSLWVISGSNVICYTNLNTSPTAALTLSSLSEPLDVAVCPTNAGLILVADGGGNQQVKAFNNAGAPLWSYGLPGGYQANGSAVATNKFWFTERQNDATFLCFAPDGSFWVGDGGNFRSLHFSAACGYIEQIMYQPHSYVAAVDQNNPCRVFSQFLEFKVDYSKPLPEAWTLVKNWKVNVPAVNITWNSGAYDDEGIYEVTTFPNGRTYALVDNNTYTFAMSEFCELAANQLRLTGLYPAYSSNRGWISLGPDGSARRTTIGASTWYESTLSSFDASNNPIWNSETLIASASSGSTDPAPRDSSFGNVRTTISSNNILISFDQSLNNGWHLGGVRVGSTNWLWKASPAVGFMNGCGTYEISNGVTYAGNTVQAVDRNVIYGYHGEFFRGQGQAGQTMHFFDDGLFAGQFGEASPGHSAYEGALPGFAGNGHSPSLVKTTNGDFYLWVNDESDHGPQRWHFVNARNIREQTGSGTLGGAITLSSQDAGFPTGVAGKSGNQSGELSWLPVPGAVSYNIRYSLMNGGPYSVLAGNTGTLDYVVGGLTNGQTYYFAVTAVQRGSEGIPSEQVSINPFDTTQTVLATGSMSEGGQFTPVVEISSAAPASGQPSYIGAEHYTGVLNLRELDDYGYGNLQNEIVGTQGYVIYDWQGAGSNLVNLTGPFTVTLGSGWNDISYLTRQYRVDNVLGINNGLTANPLASINIGVSDTNFHYLTVVSPAQFNYGRQCTLQLTSSSGASAGYTVNEDPGLSHVFQFLFKGNVTLWARSTAPGVSNAIVQALFLDNAAVTYLPPSSPAPVLTSSTTTLTSSQNPATANSLASLISTTGGVGGIPTGSATFFDGGNYLGTTALNSSGIATFNTTSLSASGSPHSITAVYSGDSVFAASTSAVFSQVITNSGSGLTYSDLTNGLVAYYPLAINGSDAWAGNNLTLAGSPTFSSNAVNWNGAVPTLGYSSPQQWPQSGLTVSAWINMADPTANYIVAACYGAPSGALQAAYMQFYTYASGLTVRMVQNIDANFIGRSTPAVLSSGWHFAAFTWSGGTASSSIKVYLDGVEMDNTNANSGTFTAPYSGSDMPFSVGTQFSDGWGMAGGFFGNEKEVTMYNRALSATEIGALYNNGISGGAASTTTLASSQNPAVAGSAVTFTATVSGSGGTPTGNVAFLDGSISLGTGIVNSSGVATLSTTGLSAAGSPHSITAVYSGNIVFAGSTSSGVVSQVILSPSTTTIASSQNPAPAGGTVTFTATVTGNSVGGNFVSSYITNGLIEWNKLNDGTGTLAGDSSGNGNTLPLIGAPSWGSNYLILNGLNQYGDAGSAQLTSLDRHDLTICAWINKAGSSQKGIVDKSFNTGGGYGGWSFQVLNNNRLDWWVEDGLDLQDTGGASVNLGQWTFATVVWSYATHQAAFYIDGALNSLVQNGAPIENPSGSAHLEVGNMRNNASAGAYAFDGSMHDVGIYNRALSAAEVQSNYLSSEFDTNVSIPDLLYYEMTNYPQSNSPVIFADSSTHGGTTGTEFVYGGLHWVTNVVPNNAIHFNGVNSYLDTSNTTLFNFTTNLFTINFWIQPLTANGYVMQNGTPTVNGWYVQVGGSYQIYFGTETNGTDAGILTSPGAAQEGRWDMVTIVRTGLNNATIYINGLQATSGYITSPASSSNSLIFGVDRVGAHFLDGDFWLPQIWGEALPATAIANLYFMQSSGYPWPVVAGPITSGTVAFYDGSSEMGTGNLNGSGMATFSTTALSASGSPHSITAVFAGNSTSTGSTSSVLSQVITSNGTALTSTSTQITSSQNPALVGGLVTFTATVSGSGGIPTGSVVFFDGGASLGVGTLNGSGVATYSTTTLSTGGSPHSITAVYGGNSTFSGSTSTALLQTILNTSTTAVVSSQNPALIGNVVTFTATVSGTGGTPTGSVTFFDGSTNLGVGTLNGSGVATFSTNGLSAGGSAHSITAVYGGNSGRAGSTSGVLSQIILKPSSTTVISSQNPSSVGSTVIFSATVTGGGGIPTGTVAFFDGTTNLGAGTLNGSGVAPFGIATLSAVASPHPITAVYGGDNVFAGSTSSALSQIIVNLTNGLVAYYPLAVNGNDAWAGNNLTLVGAPTFSSNAINWNGSVPTLGYSSPQQWPQAGLSISAWINMADPTANYIVAACYGAPSGTLQAAYMQFFTYTSGLTVRMVQNIDANFIGRSTPAILSSGWHFVAFTWSGGTASTSIKVYLDGAEVDNANANSGTFTGPYSGSNIPLSVGAQFSDGYGMAGKFNGSEKAVALYNRALSATEIGALYTIGIPGGTASATTLASSQNPSPAGSSVTFIATVSGSGGTPAGSVAFLDGSTTLGTGTLNSSGVATLSTKTGLSPGGSPHSITAVYSGNITFVGSTSSALSQIILSPSATTIVSSQNPALISNLVTFTATVSGSGGTPTGTVTFFDGSTNLGAGALNISDVATFSTAGLSLSGSPHSITAVYSGDSAFSGSTSGVLSQIISSSTNNTNGINLTNGLVAYYPLAANGNDAWAGNNLTLVGAPTFSSNAINWNGAVPTLGYGSPQQWPQSGLSVSAWINMADPTANYIVAACYGAPSGMLQAAYMQFFTYGSGLIARVVQNIDANFIGRSTPAVLTSGWHFVAFTWSGGTAGSSIKIYLDGAEVDNANANSGTFSGPYSGSNIPFSVGTLFSDGWGLAGKFYGSQKEVALYNRALSATEIGALYTGGIPAGTASATTIASSQNPAQAGASVTFTATVSGSGGTPTGSVAFFDGITGLGAGSLNNSGVATFSTATLSAIGSPHSITAVYGGNVTFAGSASSVLSQVITNSTALVTIPLVNASFESPAGAQGTVAGQPTGWLASNQDPFGVWNPPAGVYTNEVNDVLPSPAQGSQVLWIQAGNYIVQFLTNTLAGNQIYTLSGAIGNRGDGYGEVASDQVYVSLLAGNTIVAQNTNLIHPPPGGFLPWTVVYTTPTAGFPSGPLQIRLGQNGVGQVHFDNIMLTAGPASP